MTKLQGDILDKSTAKIGIFKNTRLSETKRSNKQKITKDVEDLNNPIHKLDLIDIYGYLYPMNREQTFSSMHKKYLPRLMRT